jgi:hypothetical protein
MARQRCGVAARPPVDPATVGNRFVGVVLCNMVQRHHGAPPLYLSDDPAVYISSSRERNGTGLARVCMASRPGVGPLTAGADGDGWATTWTQRWCSVWFTRGNSPHRTFSLSIFPSRLVDVSRPAPLRRGSAFPLLFSPTPGIRLAGGCLTARTADECRGGGVEVVGLGGGFCLENPTVLELVSELTNASFSTFRLLVCHEHSGRS